MFKSEKYLSYILITVEPHADPGKMLNHTDVTSKTSIRRVFNRFINDIGKR